MDRTQVRVRNRLLVLVSTFAKHLSMYALGSILLKLYRTLSERVCAVLETRCVKIRTCRTTEDQWQRGIQDRRPLAPAAVAKMIIKREDDSIVDPEYVNWIINFKCFGAY